MRAYDAGELCDFGALEPQFFAAHRPVPEVGCDAHDIDGLALELPHEAIEESALRLGLLHLRPAGLGQGLLHRVSESAEDELGRAGVLLGARDRQQRRTLQAPGGIALRERRQAGGERRKRQARRDTAAGGLETGHGLVSFSGWVA